MKTIECYRLEAISGEHRQHSELVARFTNKEEALKAQGLACPHSLSGRVTTETIRMYDTAIDWDPAVAERLSGLAKLTDSEKAALRL